MPWTHPWMDVGPLEFSLPFLFFFEKNGHFGYFNKKKGVEIKRNLNMNTNVAS
jgi:hypothetical protein